ncbi:MAG TPA: type I-E CRISPR-associated protein Cse1/CasA, partial [Acidisoma sp.]|uniref:type I-E CRISPR-associated protein Cse1/CasA n=1 Tax=Acidisoma sp. TaxID=1872115 RepID=UPI002C374595
MLNLLTDPWLPARRRDGELCVISPAQITDDLTDNPIVAITWPRADFRVATLEFLTGLLTTAYPPADMGEWAEGWHDPPSPETLAAAFAPFAHAFVLDGDGPRFLQDFEFLVAESEPAENLLIEVAGNSGLLVHPGRITQLGRPAAAIALYTLQSWAPSGGRGNRTGLRGGGPLVTMVVPRDTDSLWHQIWANVPEGDPPASADLPQVFPW